MQLHVLTEYEKEHLSERQPLPDKYVGLPDEEMDRRITEAKQKLGKRLVILGHHYQRDEVIKFADYTGDSYKLAQQVSKHPDAEFIVFCGVHFMAESADVLSAPHQQVILPDLAAGCSMSDMAAPDQLEMCWKDLDAIGATRASGTRAGVIPVTYINSAAAIKAFVGERGGVVCTSSNAAATLKWAWERGERVLFLPDQHLGRNTAYKMGVPLDRMVVWDPDEIVGGLDADAALAARMILWKGHCSVHTKFSVRQIEAIRARHPGVRVIVHPEVPFEVVQAADDAGSTEYIIRQVKNSPPGSVWAVGTEIHLVNRLAHDVAPDRTVLSLDNFGCLCSTMFRVSPNHLLWILESLLEGQVHNRIVVPDAQKHWVKVALDRMLSIS
ncbi:MAG TPA: quinolinate synthase NadA [Vicinamibacterales bacterium]|jgi:quinolinate synthase|nr:quinolinate synthase NadA [Vicinamibacterales bacterium]